MNGISFIIEHWLTLAISLVVAIWFMRKQWSYFSNNRLKLKDLKNFFLTDRTEYATFQRDEVAQIQNAKGKGNTSLNNLINEINLYIQKSIGTADFNIIQNKTERCIESMYEHATGELSFPTYYGLMGTFSGTFVGLIGFLISGSDLSDENKVTNLIIGVLVSMATSLFGLFLTTKSNHDAAITKKQLDEEKNEFLDFIQLELIPKLQTTITTLQQTMEGFVPKFDVVINNFEHTFTKVIGRFKDTFDQCTDNFGTEFRQNSSHISRTVSALNESIGKITANVENQRLLLAELKSEKMFDTLQQFVESAELFQSSTNSINEYNTILHDMVMVSQHLIEKQTEYANSLEIPSELVRKLTSLLNRISTFEENINALGENISQAEMLGNQEMALIKRHLESFEEKKQLVDRYLDTNNDELTELFKLQTKTVKSLFDGYRQQLEDERDALNAMVREMMLIINKKKTDLLNHLEHAFDVAKVHTMFSHLQTLPEIAAKLDEMESMIVSTEQMQESVEKIMKIQTVLSHLKSLPDISSRLDEIDAKMISSEQMNGHAHELMKGMDIMKDMMQENSSGQIKAIAEEGEKLATTMNEIDNQQRGVYSEKLKQTTQNLIGRANLLQDTINEKVEIVCSDIEAQSLQIDKLMQKTTSELKSNIAQVSEDTKHLRRDITREVSSNVASEINKISSRMHEQGKSTEQLIRTTSDQSLSELKKLIKDNEILSLIENMDKKGKTIQEILDILKHRNN